MCLTSLVSVDNSWCSVELVPLYGTGSRGLARIAGAGVYIFSGNNKPSLDAVARYVGSELQLQVQLCQQPHHSTLRSREHVSAHEYALTLSQPHHGDCHVLCTPNTLYLLRKLACHSHPSMAAKLQHCCGSDNVYGSGLALSSVAEHGDMDTCCRRLAALDFLVPACTSLSAPSFPVMSKHSSRVSVSGSVTVSLRMRE